MMRALQAFSKSRIPLSVSLLLVVLNAYKHQAIMACLPIHATSENPQKWNYSFYVWIFFRLIGTTWNKGQRGLTLLLKSSLLIAWVLGHFRLWGHTTNLITIVSGILHRWGTRARQQQQHHAISASCGVACRFVPSIPHRNTTI